MYRREKHEPIPLQIDDAAAQRNFYSRPSEDGQPTLDDLITDYETRLTSAVNEVRELNVGDPIEPLKIAEITAHLAIRSAHMRAMIKDGVFAMASALGRLASGQLDGGSIEFPAHRVPTKIQEMVSEELRERSLFEQTPVSEYAIGALLYFALRERTSDLLDETRGMLHILLGELSGNAGRLSHSAQTQAMREAMAPMARIEYLRQLSWTVVEAPQPGAILPDCTSINYDGKTWGPLFFAKQEETRAVALPLTPDKIALGVISPDEEFDLSDFNKHAADACHSFFLANMKVPELEGMLGNLGGRVRKGIFEITNEAVRSAVEPYLGVGDDAASEIQAGGRTWNRGDEAGRFSYSVQLKGFGDEDYAASVAGELGELVSDFSARLPVGALDGFTFATDYATAVHELDRGYGVSKQTQLIETDEQVGVGIPLTVLREGSAKTHIVMRATIAVGLLSEDEVERKDSRGIIASMLANVALDGLITNKFPDKMLSPILDRYEGTIYSYASGAFHAYFAASLTTWADSTVSFYEKLAYKEFRELLDWMPDAREAYHRDGDLDPFFDEFMDRIGSLLKAISRMTGAYKALDRELDRSTDVGQLLVSEELWDWMLLFAHDLARFDERLEEWRDFEEIYFVQRHLERLAAHFSIVLDRSNEQGVYVHVPILNYEALMRG
jgi:hypothetical protein